MTVAEMLRAPFVVTDALRRAQGEVLGAFGLGPAERPFRVVDAGAGWRLRDYGGDEGASALLIVAAPIKRPYIWDLTPSVSVIRRCLERRLHVYLLEWLPATGSDGGGGMDEHARAIGRSLETIAGRAAGAKPALVGHSLGGTLAAIYATLAPESIRKLVLLGAPLSFEPGTSTFRDALVSLFPSGLADAGPVPGSLLSHLSALAAPSTFIWSRLLDAAASSADRHALDIHARVERWALDEVPLPGPLISEILDWLYRENRLCRGTLQVGGADAVPSRLFRPTLAVVNGSDEIAPLASVKGFLDAMPAGHARLIEYPGEAGVALQHLGILVGRRAHEGVWPDIFAWLDAA